VTSVLLENCGVGFAPVKPHQHQFLIELPKGVEDIPGTALNEGMTWGWESFPEYLDVLDTVRWMVDVGTQVPHAALRIYVMGDRGADVEAIATPEEIERMSQLCEEAIRAGALGSPAHAPTCIARRVANRSARYGREPTNFSASLQHCNAPMPA